MIDSNNISDASLLANLQGMTSDSRKVCSGGLFAALTGGKLDGRDYIGDALARGAKVVLVQEGSPKPACLPADTIWLEASEPRRQFAELASLFHAEKPEQIVAVTGTNGKTSSVIFLQQLWSAAGIPCASLGTLGLGKNDCEAKAVENLDSLTTPDPIDLHKLLAQLASEGITHCALEASSHGLAQHRLDGLRCSAAILTNLSQDHLDYHKTWDNYRAAKKRLFRELLAENACVVLPIDEPFAQEISKELSKDIAKDINDSLDDSLDDSLGDSLDKATVRLLTTRVEEGQVEQVEKGEQGEQGEQVEQPASLSAFDLRIDEARGVTIFSLRLARKDFGLDGEKQAKLGYILLENMQVPFVERFQLKNLLGAIAVFVALSAYSPPALASKLKDSLASLKGVPGRMQCFKHQKLARARIFVDFAHTPQALDSVLREGRRSLGKSTGRLLCLFGCGGERDRAKRPLMAEIAAKLADRIYITDDNPRREKPEAIRKEILKPLVERAQKKSPQEKLQQEKLQQEKSPQQAKLQQAPKELDEQAPFFCEVADRKKAIEQAIGDMLDGDILIVAGKGHERGQIVGDSVRPFDDASVVRATLAKIEKTVAEKTVEKTAEK